MRLAFATAALASGFAAAGLAALVIWVVTLVRGTTDPWSVAPVVVTAVAVGVALATYGAEWMVHRRASHAKRSTGEPWAYRRD